MKPFIKLLPVILGICICLQAQNPEPAGWFAGDMHVHRSCGGPPVSVSSIADKMTTQNLSAVGLLADMGNGEVLDPSTDLALVNGQDAPVSTPGRIVHWDAEWHWDPTLTQFPHQAIGGHVVALGLKHAEQIWDESTSPIFTWAHQQNAIAGFAHMQYLDAGFPQTLSCCTPLEYPVEVGLGSADFISEDVNGGDSAITAYYRLLNSGFRPGFAAGTDYPCNDGATVGSPLTYVRTAAGTMTYRNWIDGIANGRTVVSLDGHNEFLDLKVNGSAGPGDEVFLTGGGTVPVTVQWTANQNLTGTIELVANGVVVASQQALVSAGSGATLSTTVTFSKSGWLAARRMGPNGHVVHTAAVFVTVDHGPVRANATDPQFYVQWMDSLLTNTSPGGPWNQYFPTELSTVQARYQEAKALYQQIAEEAQGTAPALASIAVTPATPAISTGSTQQFTATGNYSDSSSLNITGQVVWSSSNPGVATVNLRGLAAAVSPGTTVITATQAGVSNTAVLTVQLPQPPVISNVTVSNVTTSGATISWTTDVASDSQVVYGTTPAYGSASALDSRLVTSHTVTLAGLSANVTYHFAVKSQDASGNLATSADATFATTISSGTIALSLWPSTAAPVLADAGPDSPVNLGVRFHSDVDGTVVGIRFYKSPGNTGTHFGYLYTADGALLESVQFTNETASGWQEADFPTPLAITANTDYVAAYFCPNGHYSADPNYFSADRNAAPLHAPAGSALAPNGSFTYGSPGLFPTSPHADTNYWVDAAVTVLANAIPPSVAVVTPSAGSVASITDAVTAAFVRPIDASTLTTSTFLLTDAANNVVPATVTWDSSNNLARLQPTAPLSYSTTYTATLTGGATDPRIKDINGNPLPADFTWSFTTKNPPPAPPTDTTTPILLITSAANGFSGYYAEILRNEGFTEFSTSDIGQLSATLLSNYDLVLLPEMSLTADQVNTLQTWVLNGGNLIAMRPDKQLVAMLGVTDDANTLSDAYLAINTASGPGFGITSDSMQFHDTADLYTLNSATNIATLYSNATTALNNPAVAVNNFGAGEAAFFAYDLARSVVFTRQGNPAWSGQERDGITPIRPDDLFFGGTVPDYLDLSKVAIPQADEQQRLLANMILTMNAERRPLPRLWYLPRGMKAAIVMTGDDHGNGGTVGRWNHYIAESPANCSVDNWECVRATSYVYSDTPITPAQAEQYTSKGFELALHPLTGCADVTPASLENILSTQLTAFTTTWPTVTAPQTSRTHCVVWSDYDMVPQAEVAHGIRLDTNYYYWPGTWILDRPGFMTGSGMPMRLATRNGTVVDVYQAPTQMTDESGQNYPFTVNTLLDNALGPLGYYGVFTVNMHNDNVASPGADAIVASAQSHGVPVVSAKQMLTWLDARNGSAISAVNWDGTNLGFHLQAAAAANGLDVMIPASVGTAPLTRVLLNGFPVLFPTQTIKGMQYAFVNGATGTYRASYGEPQGTLTVTAQNVSKSYGDPDPPFTVAITGFVNNDPPTVVTGTPDCTSTADTSTPPGTAPITCSVGTMQAINYVFGSFIPGTLTVTPATPAVLLSVQATQPAQPTSLLTAQVQSTGPALPTGTIQFFDGAAPLGAPVALVASGGVAQAALQFALSAGAHSITASYSGDTNYAATVSAAASVTIAPPHFLLKGTGGNTSLTVAAGKDAVFNILLDSQGFAGSVSFNCSGAPADTTCTVNPNPVTLNGTGDAPLSVTVTNTQNARLTTPLFRPSWFVLAGMFLGFFSGFNRKRRKVVFYWMAVFIMASLVACGGGGSSSSLSPAPTPTPSPGTPAPTNAVITVTGSSGAQSATITLNLTITH